MKVLLLLAAQHAGLDDIFTQLVPKSALAALFSRIVGTNDAEHIQLSSTKLQDWLLAENIVIPSRLVLDLFIGANTTDAASQADFVRVRSCLELGCDRHIWALRG